MSEKSTKLLRAGVFDSGVGGLSVLKSLVDAKKFSEIIYYGDTARVPYGVKDRATIIKFAREAVDFFCPLNIDILIVACNTVSAYALEEMRKIAPFLVVGVLEPGVLALTRKIADKNAKILILATKATINSRAYENALESRGYGNLQGIATSLFVPIVEEGIFNGAVLESAMEYYFSALDSAPDAVILGCTHFPLIAPAIAAYFQRLGSAKTGTKTLLVHSGEAMVEFLETRHNLSTPRPLERLEFFASDNVDSLKNVANLWLNL